jgi:hypothetical protein
LNARPNQYAAGTAVPVRYDHANPAESAIDATSSGQRTLGLGIAAVVGVVGILCLLKGLL